MRLLAMVAVGVTTAGFTSGVGVARSDGPDARAVAESSNGCAEGAVPEQCLQVRAELDRPLSMSGGEAQLTVNVTAPTSVPRMRVEIDLPALARWTRPPANTTVERFPSPVPTDHGEVSRASTVVAMDAGETLTWRAGVKAVSTGTELVTARAFSLDAPEAYSGSATAVSNIGGTPQLSSLGTGSEDTAGAAAPVPAGVHPTRATPRLQHDPAPLTGPAPSGDETSTDPSAAGTACASGEFMYTDQTGAWRVAPNVAVQAWDEDDFNPDDLLGQVVTDENGDFELCFSNDDISGGVDLYLIFALENDVFRVGYEDETYTFRTKTRNDIDDGTNQQFGAQSPAEQRYMRAVHAFDEANDAWYWTPGHCWDRLDDQCRQAKIEWNWGYDPPNSHYSRDDEMIHLQAEAPDYRSIVVHEMGHSVMDDVYEGDFPEANCPSPHYIPRESGVNCAWTEGFADWYQAAVYDDPRYVGMGFTVELEDPTWTTQGWDDGDGVEGRVAGAMIDLTDMSNEGDDNYTESPTGPIWNTFLRHRVSNFSEFWKQRAADGHDVSRPALGALYQSTIDYGY